MAPFKPRERKHKRLAKNGGQKRGAIDANVETIIPETQTEREARRLEIAAELRAQRPAELRISGKKRKRLDKYVDTKLRKEENLELLKKLAAQKIDTSLLQSSKKLGRVSESKRERLSRALNEQNAGLDVHGDHEAILLQRRKDVPASPVAQSDTDEVDESSEEEPVTNTFIASQAIKPVMTFGSGLKRPLEMDETGQPKIKRRKRRKPVQRKPTVTEERAGDSESERDQSEVDSLSGEGSDDQDEWHGFDSDVEQDGGGSEAVLENSTMNGYEEDSSSSQDDSEYSEMQSEAESASSVTSDKPGRVSAFKAWADSQRNAAVGFHPSAAPTQDAQLIVNFEPRPQSPDPMLASLSQTYDGRTTTPAAAITISRSEEIQSARLELPVVQEEQRIMEAIHHNPVVIICGATGSGKTTQVPQMLFESGYGSHIGLSPPDLKGRQSGGLIGITQPRRVAAVSVAERVAFELGTEYGSRVAHQVRYDTNINRGTAIKFMTDGILLREISKDFILSKYSAIVIDEAHERSVNTDILIGMLSRIVHLRLELSKEEPDKHYPLKLVIMSATLRVSDFAENPRLFPNATPPIIQAEGRQYPVTEHFSRTTRRDYVAEMVNKVARGHRKLPPGGILVFLTAQNEIQTVAARLKDKLGSNTAGFMQQRKSRLAIDDIPLELDDLDAVAGLSSRKINGYLEGEDSDEDSEVDINGLDDEDQEFQVDVDEQADRGPRGDLKPHILPLYAALPSVQQLRVFQTPPEDSRLIVLATNVAETSLTIPGVRYVFDCGRSKEKRYDSATGVQTFEVDWISKASAAQRSGRAGRTGPGHCYRLFSSAVYEQFFAEHTVPEILRTPLESTVLQLKSMDIDNIANFPFPTAPDAIQLAQADRLLRNLGAIGAVDGRITRTGREIMAFPVNPRYGKMLLLAQKNGVLAAIVALVAALAVGELFIAEVQLGSATAHGGLGSDDASSEEDRRFKTMAESAVHAASKQQHEAYTRAHAALARWDDQSDATKLLTTVAAHAEASAKNKAMGAASKFCIDYFLREKGMLEVQQLRHQLHDIVNARDRVGAFTEMLPLPSETQRKMLSQIVAAGYIDQVAIRSDLLQDQTSAFGRKPRRAVEVAYRTLVASAEPDKALSAQEQERQRSVFVHSSSVLSHLSAKEMPDYIIYSHLSRPAPSTIAGTQMPKTRMHPLATIGPKQLAALAEGTPMLDFGKPIGKIEEVAGSGKRQCWIAVSLRAPGSSGSAWPLSAWKVLQKRSKSSGAWELEKVIAR